MITDFRLNDPAPQDCLEDYPMKLYLVQHGEAVSKAENPERPLSEQGQVVCLESVEPGDWQIQWMLRPELLRSR